MLPQQFLTMASQSIEVVASRFTDCQRLKRSIEVMRTLKAQQGLFEITPSPDLWWGTKTERQMTAKKKSRKSYRIKSEHSWCLSKTCMMS